MKWATRRATRRISRWWWPPGSTGRLNTGLWLVNTDHVTPIQACDWSPGTGVSTPPRPRRWSTCAGTSEASGGGRSTGLTWSTRGSTLGMRRRPSAPGGLREAYTELSIPRIVAIYFGDYLPSSSIVLNLSNSPPLMVKVCQYVAHYFIDSLKPKQRKSLSWAGTVWPRGIQDEVHFYKVTDSCEARGQVIILLLQHYNVANWKYLNPIRVTSTQNENSEYCEDWAWQPFLTRHKAAWRAGAWWTPRRASTSPTTSSS